MTLSTGTIWLIIVLLALGTFALRFSFLGLVGGRSLPDWLLRLLRYTPVAVIPGLMAPQVILPEGGARPEVIAAVAATLVVGIWRRNAITAMVAGGAALLGMSLV